MSPTVLKKSSITLVLLLLFRMFFGINFTDESYYIALAHGFVKGRILFQDELFIQQLGALVLSPILFLYERAFQLNGLVLFVRFLHFLFCLSIGYAIVRLTPAEKKNQGYLAAGMTLTYIPANIGSLSYNTIAELFFLVGHLFAWVNQNSNARSAKSYCISVLSFTIAAFSYPLFAPAAALAIIFYCYISIRSRKSWFTSEVVASITVVGISLLSLAIWIFSTGKFEAIKNLLAFNQQLGIYAGGTSRMMLLFSDLGRLIPLLAVTFFGFSVGNSHFGRSLSDSVRLSVTALIFALGSVYLFWLNFDSPSNSYWIITLATYLYFNRKKIDQKDLSPLYASCGLAAVCLAWGSSGGLFAAALALVPVVVFGISNFQTFQKMHIVAISVVIVCQVAILFRTVYQDRNLFWLRTQISNGAYTGLMTSRARSLFIDSLTRDLQSLENQERTVLFLDYFPAGYLLTNMKPFTPAIWLLGPNNIEGPIEYRQQYAKYFVTQNRFPSVVVKMLQVPSRNDHMVQVVYFPEKDPVLKLVNEMSRYELSIRRADYEIYTLR